MNDQTQTPKRRGCFFYGCISLVVLFLLGAVLAVVLVMNAPKILSRWAVNYTDTAPAQLEKVEVPPAELRSIQERVAAFQQAVKFQTNVVELTLTGQELNALINGDPSLKDFKDRIFVTIEGSAIRGQVSWPLQDFGPIKLKGRWLNGEVAFRPTLENGTLGVFVEDVRVKGQSLPGPLLAQFKRENLAQGIQKDPQTAAEIRKMESLRVEDGKLILRTRLKE